MVRALSRYLAILLTATSILISGCSTNPVTGRSELSLISERQELAIGQRQFMPAQQSAGGTYSVDTNLVRYVNKVGQRLAAVSDRDLPYEFVVINDSTPNAWALPGGKIAINRGLLMALENEAELAAVLGHEIVHAAARHGARTMERAMLLEGVVTLTAAGLQDSEYSNYIIDGASVGAQMINHRYGRNAELEADHYGMIYMARAGYDPSAAVSLQQKFVKLNAGRSETWLSGLFASHPPSKERVAQNKQQASLLSSQATRDWELGRDRFNNQLAYLADRRSAYEAFDQARTLINEREASVAMNRINRSIKLEPKEPRFYGLRADISFAQENFQQAITDYDKALDKDNSFYKFYLGRGLSHARLGNRSRARSDLEKSNSLLPTARATNELGHLSLADGNRDQAKQYFSAVAATSGPLSQSARQAFVRLDLADNPAAYFRGQAVLRDTTLVVIITNQSGLTTRDTVVQIRASIDGQYRQIRRKITTMSPESQITISTGWQADRTNLSEIDIRVIAAST